MTYLINAFPVENMVALGQSPDLFTDLIIAKAHQAALTRHETDVINATVQGRSNERSSLLPYLVEAGCRGDILAACDWGSRRAKKRR